jgi:hypothetical protein
MSVKRLNYFNHQFLEEQDFRDEQQYHIEMRRRANRALHTFGVAEGLQVTRSGNLEITIEPGFALDREGRELVLLKPVSYDIGHLRSHRQLHVLISHKERLDEADRRSHGGVEGFIRVTEYVEVGATHEPDKFPLGIPLATIHLDEQGGIRHIDNEGRVHAGSVLAALSIHNRHLADGIVTGEKLAPGLRESLEPEKFQLADNSITAAKLDPALRAAFGAGAGGWVRLPFKPLPLRAKGYRAMADEAVFHVDVQYAHCDARGARGTMGIPVPGGATWVQEFRIAGVAKGKKIRIQVYRTGWNPHEKRGEFTEILNEEFFHAEFDKIYRAERELDVFHTLSLAVHSEGEAEIWLVAARFR